MLVRAYLEWMATASVADRAEAVTVLSQTLLARCLSHDDAVDSEAALVMALDDPAVVVRRALAEAMCMSEQAPRTIILALAHDISTVAAHVLLRSPVLSDADLEDAVQAGDAIAQTAVALRPSLNVTVSSAIARFGAIDAVIALCANPAADIAPGDFQLIAERHKTCAELRGVLLERDDLPMAVRQLLVSATAEALRGMMLSTGWLPAGRAERCVMDAERHATVDIASQCDRNEIAELVETLRKDGRLTPNLLLRAVLCGETQLFSATLSILSGLSQTRITSMLDDPTGSAFSAAYERAKLPASLKTAFVAALLANQRSVTADGKTLDLAIVRAALLRVSQEKSGGNNQVMALLRRYEAEAMRGIARDITQELMAAKLAIEVTEPVMPAIMLEAATADPADAVPPEADNDGLSVSESDRFEARPIAA